ncbi:MAG: helix-turn-helix transcriptional regulator [Mesorhizobium sp.]|nr:MAG: helix-turn-helix transcriptional regulator [Mesorhizobium sp.]
MAIPTKRGPTKRGPTKRLPTKRLPLLPAERALKVISGRWKAVILYHLFDGPRRLSVLKTLVPDITQKVLIQQLREMEEHGLIRREIFAEIPSRVEYSATRLGLSLEPILLALCEWGQHHADELNEMDRVTDCIIRPRQARQPAIA